MKYISLLTNVFWKLQSFSSTRNHFCTNLANPIALLALKKFRPKKKTLNLMSVKFPQQTKIDRA